MNNTNAIVHLVDLTKQPVIYATNNPEYYSKYCIDLFPESLPTLLPFESAEEAHKKLIELFGNNQHQTWFPEVYAEPHSTCEGCYGYKPTREIRRGYCVSCCEIMGGIQE